MGWTTLIALILQEGLPLALKLYDKWNVTTPVTAADIDELKALGSKTPRSQVLDALTRAGINPSDPKAVALLALVGP